MPGVRQPVREDGRERRDVSRPGKTSPGPRASCLVESDGRFYFAKVRNDELLVESLTFSGAPRKSPWKCLNFPSNRDILLRRHLDLCCLLRFLNARPSVARRVGTLITSRRPHFKSAKVVSLSKYLDAEGTVASEVRSVVRVTFYDRDGGGRTERRLLKDARQPVTFF